MVTIESRVILAIEAKRMNLHLSLYKLAVQFDAPRTTLQYRMAGCSSKVGSNNRRTILTAAEEEAVVQYILDQDAQGFPSQRADVQEMANLLLDNIDDADFYNFDETGFMMGMIYKITVVIYTDRCSNPKLVQPSNREWAIAICAVAADGHIVPPFLCIAGRFHLAPWYQNGNIPLNWVLQHFDKATQLRQVGRYRMLMLDGHKSHINAEFNNYCKEKDIIPLCLPPHSSHLTQLLDVGIFGLLKWAYSDQISRLIRRRITYVTKDEFFPAFKAAFDAVFTEQNIKGGFRGSGLVPWDPEAVILKLDMRVQTPTTPQIPAKPLRPWVSQTPQNATEALLQSTLIKDRIARHQGSSPTPISQAVDQLTKAVVTINNIMTLMTGEVRQLREANEILSKRRRAKRSHLQDSGPLTGLQASQLLEDRGLAEEEGHDKGAREGSSKRRCTTTRACRICRKPGHYAKTCPEAVDISSLLDTDSD
ncbi:hypothetical protein V491_00368 [Pseudogymnoascus sp. VKM F-3775]|nr:hypothetical protein V491_00368 [Pseudogymnoascus sp. VKM F-3775]